MSLLASSTSGQLGPGGRRRWNPRHLVLLAAVLPLLVLAACHQEFGTAGHGGPAVGSGQPSLTNVRTAIHPGFDRIVFDFSGSVPAYFVEYVAANQLRNTKGDVVPVSGSYFLRVRFDGTNSPSNALLVRTPNYPEVKQVKGVDNFEGVLIYGVGVSQRNAFRVFALQSPNRVVLDVQN